MKEVLITLFFCILVYFFILKPQVVRKVCDRYANDISVFVYPIDKYPDTDERGRLQSGLYEDTLNLCIMQNR